jgi:Skp family chaperone for outer membrane proteins
MSDTTEAPFDVRAILARIDRDLMESAKLREESEKFIAEQKKLTAEEAKLRSEARKLDRDRWIAPWLAITGLAGGFITVAGAIWRLLH